MSHISIVRNRSRIVIDDRTTHLDDWIIDGFQELLDEREELRAERDGLLDGIRKVVARRDPSASHLATRFYDSSDLIECLERVVFGSRDPLPVYDAADNLLGTFDPSVLWGTGSGRVDSEVEAYRVAADLENGEIASLRFLEPAPIHNDMSVMPEDAKFRIVRDSLSTSDYPHKLLFENGDFDWVNTAFADALEWLMMDRSILQSLVTELTSIAEQAIEAADGNSVMNLAVTCNLSQADVEEIKTSMGVDALSDDDVDLLRGMLAGPLAGDPESDLTVEAQHEHPRVDGRLVYIGDELVCNIRNAGISFVVGGLAWDEDRGWRAVDANNRSYTLAKCYRPGQE